MLVWDVSLANSADLKVAVRENFFHSKQQFHPLFTAINEFDSIFMSDVCMAYLNMMGMQWEVVAMGTPAHSNFILIIHSGLSTHLSGSVVRLQINILLSV